MFALGRVYRNLILNAIQATAPGGLIVVATEARADRVQVRIYDTGCGIPPERLGAIFEDFVTTKRRGLGLGLAISKKIVEQLGGTITVASEVGKGTTFVLEFPRTRRGRCWSPASRTVTARSQSVERGTWSGLVKTQVDGRHVHTRFYELKTAGARRFSCEVVLDAGDRIILDDDSLTSLERR